MSNNYVGLVLFLGISLGVLMQSADHKKTDTAKIMMLQHLTPSQKIVQLQQK